jgi:hypothetical protein
MDGTTIALIIGFGGWFVALLQYYLGYRERKERSEGELLAKTLDYFTGKSQGRSIGISLVEGIWLPKKKHLDVIVPVLVNQAVYLLLSTDSTDSAHEERNLIRLLQLLDRCIPLTSEPEAHQPEIMDAILRKDPKGGKKGIPLGRQTLRLWYVKFGGDNEYYDAEQPAAADA